jgi:acyl-CoA thioesterase-2
VSPDRTPLDDLVALLDLERLDDAIFRGHSPGGSPLPRVFGGQVAGQALVACERTVPEERVVHSRHGYFLRGGDPGVPIIYEVDKVRDGRSFTTRRVLAMQRGEVIFQMSASFQLPEDGPEHQVGMPDVPGPDELLSLQDLYAPYLAHTTSGRWLMGPRPIDMRYIGLPPQLAAASGAHFPAYSQVWFRADGALPDAPALHACVLAYASDMTLLDSSLMRHGLAFDGTLAVGASLDHAMWFHRPFRADEWLLYDQSSPNGSGARALGVGRIFDQQGRLVASVVQEGLIRRPRHPGERPGPGMTLPQDGH